MTEDKTDWKVQVILDRDRIVSDMVLMLEILKRQRINVVVSASTEVEAIDHATRHLARVMDIPIRYVKALHPRRMPS